MDMSKATASGSLTVAQLGNLPLRDLREFIGNVATSDLLAPRERAIAELAGDRSARDTGWIDEV